MNINQRRSIIAKLISHVWSVIRGSVGGITYFAGPGNTILARTKTAPVNPGTDWQGIVRESLVNAAALWKEVLTPAQRDDWDLYASTLAPSGPLGPYSLTGQQAFIQSYVTQGWFERNGAAVVPSVNPPVISGFLDVGGYQLTDRVNPGAGFQLEAQNHAVEDAIIQVQLSGAWTDAKHFYRGPWQNPPQFFDIAGGTSSSFDIDVEPPDFYYFARIKALSAQAPYRTQQAIILRHVSAAIP